MGCPLYLFSPLSRLSDPVPGARPETNNLTYNCDCFLSMRVAARRCRYFGKSNGIATTYLPYSFTWLHARAEDLADRRSAAPRSGGGLQSKGSGGCEKMKRCRPGAGRATRRPQRVGKAVVRVRMPRQRHPWAGLFDIVNRGRTASRRLSVPGRCRASKVVRVPGAAQHEAKRNDALQTRDRYEHRFATVSGAPLRLRCAASGTRQRRAE
jgi:hypothetical protein